MSYNHLRIVRRCIKWRTYPPPTSTPKRAISRGPCSCRATRCARDSSRRPSLKDAVLVNNVRGVQGYTGYYEGKRVSVMASGMGMPSIGIYSYELFNFYGVENIIRVGSAGAMSEKLKLRDVVAGMRRVHQFRLRAAVRLPGHAGPVLLV